MNKLLPAAALTAFLVLPGHPLSLIGGLPLGPLALGCAVLIGIGVFAGWPLPRKGSLSWLSVVVLVLAGLKLVLALTAPRYGLEASYYPNDRFAGEPERSTFEQKGSYTRLDSLIDFGNDEFPLYFLNDSSRFNSSGADRLDRGRSLIWSARWKGFLNAPGDGPANLWLTASGPAELSLDDQRLLRVDADGRATDQARLQLSRGPHKLELQYARKRERSGYLQLSTDLTPTGGLLPSVGPPIASPAGEAALPRRLLGAPLITAEPYETERLALDQYAAQAARVLDVAFLGLLTAVLGIWVVARVSLPAEREESTWARLERPLLALVPLGFLLHAALPRLDRFGKMVFLGGGQDWLTHETLARDIQLNGPLMTLGQPLGQGALFYAQPLYPYYLALLHTISGEDLYGVTTLQVLGLGVAAVIVYEVARRVFGRPTAVVALALTIGVLIPFELAWVARLLISEALYFWLMPAAVLALIVAARKAHAPAAVLAGALLGLACLTRGPTLLYLPPAAVLLWLSLRRHGWSRAAAMRTLAIVGLSAGLLIALVPIRNLVVAGKPALTASSGGVNLEKLHRPSDKVRLGNIENDPLHRAIDVDRPTREVIEYLRQDPAGYFASYLPLAAYTLGFGSALNHLLDEQPVQLQPELVVLNFLYLLALIVVPRARGLESGFVHAFIGAHFLTMIVFAPYDYENRLVTPMYLFVTIFAAAVLTRAGRSLAALSCVWQRLQGFNADGSGPARTIARPSSSEARSTK